MAFRPPMHTGGRSPTPTRYGPALTRPGRTYWLPRPAAWLRNGFLQQLEVLDTTMSQAANWMWRDNAHILLVLEAQRHRSNARFRWLYGAILVGYAALVVALGVLVDAGLAVTPIASITASLAAAFIIWTADRRLVSPRLEHWSRQQNVRLLQAELSACALTLSNIRSVQVEIDAMADYTGVAHIALLNPALLA